MFKEFISNIFIRAKKDGKICIILNLKQLNSDHMSSIHFKMETLKHVVESMKKNCYFASTDISEAYCSIQIRKEDREYFLFLLREIKKFTALIIEMIIGIATCLFKGHETSFCSS